jgi:hypothetical protein
VTDPTPAPQPETPPVDAEPREKPVREDGGDAPDSAGSITGVQPVEAEDIPEAGR